MADVAMSTWTAPENATYIQAGFSSPQGLLYLPGRTAVTTYFYRATDGSRGSTTAEASIPAGAIVEGIVTS